MSNIGGAPDFHKVLRNSFFGSGKYEIPSVYKQETDLKDLAFIGFHNTKSKDTKANEDKTVHFFIEDEKFECVWNNPRTYINRFKQYRQLLSPDFSLYTDMPLAIQVYNTFRRRWCDAYWQSNGLKIIPAVTWGAPESFEFCFDGVQKGSAVAVSTLGCIRVKDAYMEGFKQMCLQLEPSHVICYYKPFNEMHHLAPILHVPYERHTKTTKPQKESS